MSDNVPTLPPTPEDFGLPAQRNPYGGNGQLAPQQTQPGTIASVEEARALGELKAEIMLAQMLPRDEQKCTEAILNDCGRLSVADGATWTYPRGKEKLSGPSVKLLEAIARRWRNIDHGWKVTYQDDERSEVIAYCWDKETNMRNPVQFTVPHYRWVSGKKVKLTDPRDIYEIVANLAQRRKRSCMEHVIPAEVIKAAVATCQKTVAANIDISADGLKRLLGAFAEFDVTQAQIETRLKCRISAISPGQYLQLREIYTALKEGLDRASTWFEPVQAQAPVSPYPPTPAGTRIAPDAIPEPPRQQEPPKEPPAPTPTPPTQPPQPPLPPAASAAPVPQAPPPQDDPPLDGGNGNGEGDVLDAFEGIVVDEHGAPLDGEVILDPLHYAQEILAAWTQSQDKAEFVARNLAGIQFAKSCDPQADALLDGLDEAPAETTESAETTERAVLNEGADKAEPAAPAESAEARERPPTQAPAESKPADLDDKDIRMANSMIVHVSTLRGAEIVEYSKSPAVLVPIQRWQRDGKQALVDRVKAVFTKRLEETRDRRDG